MVGPHFRWLQFVIRLAILLPATHWLVNAGNVVGHVPSCTLLGGDRGVSPCSVGQWRRASRCLAGTPATSGASSAPPEPAPKCGNRCGSQTCCILTTVTWHDPAEYAIDMCQSLYRNKHLRLATLSLWRWAGCRWGRKRRRLRRPARAARTAARPRTPPAAKITPRRGCTRTSCCHTRLVAGMPSRAAWA